MFVFSPILRICHPLLLHWKTNDLIAIGEPYLLSHYKFKIPDFAWNQAIVTEYIPGPELTLYFSETGWNVTTVDSLDPTNSYQSVQTERLKQRLTHILF